MSEPQTEFIKGLPTDKRKKGSISYWQEVVKAINEAVAEARHNPETARSLFQLASYGHNDAISLEQFRDEFAKDQIPREFLSHFELGNPFTRLSLTYWLSDQF